MGASADNGHGPWAGGPPGWGELSSQDWGERGETENVGIVLGLFFFFFQGFSPKEIKQHKNNQGTQICGPEVGMLADSRVEGGR